MASVDEPDDRPTKLTEAEQQDLADLLYQRTLPDVPGEEISPEEWQRVWAEEINRRSDELHAGTTPSLDAFEALEKLRREPDEERKKRRQP